MIAIESVRPLVRYVDESQAVVEVTVTTHQTRRTDAVMRVEIHGDGGFHDECMVDSPGSAEAGTSQARVRLELVHPDRWWPASMGPQPLYELTVALLVDGVCVDEKLVTFGLTSIRAGADEPSLLVNGQVCDLHHVVMVDRINERELLPATGDSLLLVRDHYGPDVLYYAADRAGILTVQCIPIDAAATPEAYVAAQVGRLSAHPSLAGWFVGHLGRIADSVAQRIARVDPTRAVFRALPVAG